MKIEVTYISYNSDPPSTGLFATKYESLGLAEDAIPMKKGNYSKGIQPKWCKNGEELMFVFFKFDPEGSNYNVESFNTALSGSVLNFKAKNNGKLEKVNRVNCRKSGGRKRKRRRKTKRKMKRKSKRKMKRKTKRRRKRRRR